jgi:hypothetical protein
MLTTHLVSRFRINGNVPLLPHTYSWHLPQILLTNSEQTQCYIDDSNSARQENRLSFEVTVHKSPPLIRISNCLNSFSSQTVSLNPF